MSSISSSRPALADILSVVLPPPNDTLLLRACLQTGESGQEACRAWLRQYQGPDNAIKSEFTKALLPLFFNALRTHGIQVDNVLLTILRTAALREELRTKTYRNICRRVLSGLAGKNIPAIVIKGAALADTVYAAPALRHNHDIELLVKQRDLVEIIALLVDLGFSSPRGIAHPDWQTIQLTHDSGLPLVLRHQLFSLPFLNLPPSDLWFRSHKRIVSDVPARILSPTDALLSICGEASYSPTRESFHWASDAWFIIDRYRDLDWELLLDCAVKCHLALPLSVTLGYIAADLEAPVPTSFLRRLSKAASKTTAIGRDLALFGARLSIPGSCRSLLLTTRSWRGRAAVIRSLLLPSPKYLLWRRNIHTAWFLPWYYVNRPLRYVTPRIVWIIKRVMRYAGTKLAEGFSRITC